jgi:hypothetical protein
MARTSPLRCSCWAASALAKPWRAWPWSWRTPCTRSCVRYKGAPAGRPSCPFVFAQEGSTCTCISCALLHLVRTSTCAYRDNPSTPPNTALPGKSLLRSTAASQSIAHAPCCMRWAKLVLAVPCQLLRKSVYTSRCLQVSIGIDPYSIFKEADWALMIGAKPRGPGMERADLLNQNGEIFQMQVREWSRRHGWVLSLRQPHPPRRTHPASCSCYPHPNPTAWHQCARVHAGCMQRSDTAVAVPKPCRQAALPSSAAARFAPPRGASPASSAASACDISSLLSCMLTCGMTRRAPLEAPGAVNSSGQNSLCLRLRLSMPPPCTERVPTMTRPPPCRAAP